MDMKPDFEVSIFPAVINLSTWDQRICTAQTVLRSSTALKHFQADVSDVPDVSHFWAKTLPASNKFEMVQALFVEKQ